MTHEGEPIGEGDKKARDAVEETLEETQTEQPDEAAFGQIHEVQGGLFAEEEPPPE
jgi:hypothetical protein